MAALKHNHPNNDFGALEPPESNYPRRDERRAQLNAQGRTQHSHAGPFGFRRVAGCPRCIELVQGAEPREGHGADRAEKDARRAREIKAHFADPNSKCDHIT